MDHSRIYYIMIIVPIDVYAMMLSLFYDDIMKRNVHGLMCIDISMSNRNTVVSALVIQIARVKMAVAEVRLLQ